MYSIKCLTQQLDCSRNIGLEYQLDRTHSQPSSSIKASKLEKRPSVSNYRYNQMLYSVHQPILSQNMVSFANFLSESGIRIFYFYFNSLANDMIKYLDNLNKTHSLPINQREDFPTKLVSLSSSFDITNTCLFPKPYLWGLQGQLPHQTTVLNRVAKKPLDNCLSNDQLKRVGIKISPPQSHETLDFEYQKQTPLHGPLMEVFSLPQQQR